MKPKNVNKSFIIFISKIRVLNLTPENYEGKLLSPKITILLIFTVKGKVLKLPSMNEINPS